MEESITLHSYVRVSNPSDNGKLTFASKCTSNSTTNSKYMLDVKEEAEVISKIEQLSDDEEDQSEIDSTNEDLDNLKVESVEKDGHIIHHMTLLQPEVEPSLPLDVVIAEEEDAESQNSKAGVPVKTESLEVESGDEADLEVNHSLEDDNQTNIKIAEGEDAESQNSKAEVPVKSESLEVESGDEADVEVNSLDSLEDDNQTNIKIAEGEDAESQNSEGLEEMPVKTELLEVESGEDDEIIDDGQTDIKAEPLEESYVDRISDFLLAVTSQALNQVVMSEREDKDHESGEELGDAHFLIPKAHRKRRYPRNLKCEKCSAEFKYQSTYDYHVQSQCGTKMITEGQLVHKGKDQAFTCNVCNKQMCSRTSLMVHMRIHNGERPFVCFICSRSFTQKAHLKDHMKIHSNNKSTKQLVYTCSECGDVFAAKKFLQSHMKVHFGDKIFDCDVCHKRFRTRSNLSNHKMIHSDKKDFRCTICGKEFLRKPNLDDHIRVHTKEKPFPCEICGKRFAEKNRMNTHVKRHTGELSQVCSFCGKKFACSYDLRVHQRMHTGEKPFSCNICGRMFNRKAIMETHMTIHTGRKDFVCTECGEAFNRKSKLDIHITTHSGEKFYCEICHRVFKCKAYLVPHIRTHYGQGRKKRGQRRCCNLCRWECGSTQLLQAHLLQAHPTLFQPLPPQTTFVNVDNLE